MIILHLSVIYSFFLLHNKYIALCRLNLFHFNSYSLKNSNNNNNNFTVANVCPKYYYLSFIIASIHPNIIQILMQTLHYYCSLLVFADNFNIGICNFIILFLLLQVAFAKNDDDCLLLRVFQCYICDSNYEINSFRIIFFRII